MSKLILHSKTVQITVHLTRIIVTAMVNTWLEAFIYKPSQNMNAYVRWELLLLGCLLLGVTINLHMPLHWLALLPLLSIYLIHTAVIGYEPMYSGIQKLGAYFRKHPLMPSFEDTPDGNSVVVKYHS